MRPLLSFLLLVACTFTANAQDSPAPPGAPSAPPGIPGTPPPAPGVPPPIDGPSPAASPSASAVAPTAVVEKPAQLSAVRVNVTNQPWDFLKPWGKRPPFSRRAIGAVLPGGRVLVTAELVANATFVELEAPDGGGKAPATIDVVDYESNLALLKTDDPDFMKPYAPLEVGTARVGDTLSVWQIESTGVLLVTPGTVTTIEVSRYPIDESPLLVYRLTATVQFRDASFTLPVVKDGKLAGIVMRYDNNSKNAEVIPGPVIAHFLKDAAKAPYEGFPRAGMSFSSTRDPMFRRFLKLGSVGKATANGVYVTQVLKDSPAAQAGLEEGDVILKVAGESVDQDGNYVDPEYGKVAISHLLSTKKFVGDTVPFTIARKGQNQDLQVSLARRPPELFVSDPYVIDRAPKFYILGGLVLEELSRQYLKEFGNDWVKRAPADLVYLDRFQNDLYKGESRKVVILSRVLPSDSTIGYEDLRGLIVTKVNGVELTSLSALPAALAKAENGLHKIEFDGDPGEIWMDAAEVEAIGPSLKQSYRLPILQRLE